ncbi:MAG: hypothetical protein JWR69_4624 [Pedosphaera sp.]|nr:hypothetical protein [Pedosphaera sp.]
MAPLVDHSAIKRSISDALDCGISLVLQSVKTGPMSEDGVSNFGQGWHDFYFEDRTAGAHATLEAYLFFQLPDIARRKLTHEIELEEKVFSSYLVPLFNPTPGDGWPTKKEDQRAEAEVTTTKIAKFSQCCFYSSHERKIEFAQKALGTLRSRVNGNTLALGHSVNSNDDKTDPVSIFAAAEVLRARYLWASDSQERLDLVREAMELLSPATNPVANNSWRLSSIPWLKTSLPLVHAVYTTCVATLVACDPAEECRQFFEQVLAHILRQDYFLMSDMVIETYSFKDRIESKQRTDYVSFESTLYVVQTVLSAVDHGLCSTALVGYVQPTLLAWRGGALSGYCHEISDRASINPQKNRFSYIISILRTLALAQGLFRRVPDSHNNNIAMYINPIRFPARGIVPDGRIAFLAMPFGAGDKYESVHLRLKEKCSALGFELYRTDDLKDTSLDIPHKIWSDLWRSSFMIAICDGMNPNVYYEIGLAHAIGKPVFLCAKARDQFSFDVGGIANCAYDSESLEEQLIKFINDINLRWTV